MVQGRLHGRMLLNYSSCLDLSSAAKSSSGNWPEGLSQNDLFTCNHRRPEADAASNAGAITDGLKHPPEASADPWLRLARRAREGSGRNVGQHPQKLKGLIRTNRPRVVAVGEMGLDYEQSEFCGRDLQADKDGVCR